MPAWLEVDAPQRLVKVTAAPEPGSVPFDLDVQLVVEYYARFT